MISHVNNNDIEYDIIIRRFGEETACDLADSYGIILLVQLNLGGKVSPPESRWCLWHFRFRKWWCSGCLSSRCSHTWI